MRSLLQVTVGGPGQRAGLHVGDVVLEVNGQNVAEEYLEDVIMLMKGGGRSLSLRVKGQAAHPKTPPTAKASQSLQKWSAPSIRTSHNRPLVCFPARRREIRANVFVTEALQKPTEDHSWMTSASSVLQGLIGQLTR